MVSSAIGPGIFCNIAEKSGSRFFESPPSSEFANPSLALVYKIGNSICSSVAPKSINRSYTSFTTSLIRASGLSILLITKIIGISLSRAFFKTNLVWGRGPSLASTNRSAPSTRFKLLSTSPPKSACPGVSIIFILMSL